MQSFSMTRPANAKAALTAALQPNTKYIAGGTDLMQLAKDNVETPDQLVDLEALNFARIDAQPNRLRLEALAHMSDVAAHPAVVKSWPVLSQALLLSASPQVRNMATMGGNLLQRTRCNYFRDTGFNCNKRLPGSGCPAINGENRLLAILGGSEHCIANYSGDMAVALIVLDAQIEVSGRDGIRRIPIGDFHTLPKDTPHTETTLRPGEMITAIDIPATAERSGYLKVRDRTSFAFSLVSAAVNLDVQNGTIRQARVAAGGVGTVPWHLPEVENALTGKQVSPDVLKAAADQAGAGATPASQNGFKLPLLRRTVLRALQTVSA